MQPRRLAAPLLSCGTSGCSLDGAAASTHWRKWSADGRAAMEVLCIVVHIQGPLLQNLQYLVCHICRYACHFEQVQNTHYASNSNCWKKTWLSVDGCRPIPVLSSSACLSEQQMQEMLESTGTRMTLFRECRPHHSTRRPRPGSAATRICPGIPHPHTSAASWPGAQLPLICCGDGYCRISVVCKLHGQVPSCSACLTA